MSEPYWEPFATPGMGTVQGMVPIQRIEAAAALASFDFQNIPSYFNHLRLIVVGRSDAAGVSQATCFCRFNGDAGANYDYIYIGSEVFGQTGAFVGNVTGSTAGAALAGGLDVLVPNYAATAFQKLGHFQGANKQGTTAGTQRNDNGAFFWRNAAAINRLTAYLGSGNWIAGSVATLYGILDTPMAAPGIPPSGEIVRFIKATNDGPTSITATGNGDSLFNFPSANFDAVLHFFELFLNCQDGGGYAQFEIRLHDGTAPGPLIWAVTLRTPETNPGNPQVIRIPFTPTPGAHTYHVRWRDVTTARTYTIVSTVHPLVARIVRA